MTFPLSTPSMQKTLLATVQSRLAWKQLSSKKGWMRSSLNTSRSLIQLIQRHRLHQWLIQKIKKPKLAIMDLFQARLNSITTRKNWQPSSTTEWTLIPILNGEMGKKTLDTSIQPTWILTSGFALWRKRASNELLWLLNITTDSLLTLLSTPTIP